MKRSVTWKVFLLAICLASMSAGISLTFDGLQNGEQVLSYYDGGLGGLGSGPGPNQGVTFSNGLAASSTVIAFGNSAELTASSVTMNLASPFYSGMGFLSFYFQGSGTVELYSGLNGTGLLEATDVLTPSGTHNISGVSAPVFQSVVFSGTGGTVLSLDTISLGMFEPVPEPASLMLIGLGVFVMTARAKLLIRK